MSTAGRWAKCEQRPQGDAFILLTDCVVLCERVCLIGGSLKCAGRGLTMSSSWKVDKHVSLPDCISALIAAGALVFSFIAFNQQDESSQKAANAAAKQMNGLIKTQQDQIDQLKQAFDLSKAKYVATANIQVWNEHRNAWIETKTSGELTLSEVSAPNAAFILLNVSNPGQFRGSLTALGVQTGSGIQRLNPADLLCDYPDKSELVPCNLPVVVEAALQQQVFIRLDSKTFAELQRTCTGEIVAFGEQIDRTPMLVPTGVRLPRAAGSCATATLPIPAQSP